MLFFRNKIHVSIITFCSYKNVFYIFYYEKFVMSFNNTSVLHMSVQEKFTSLNHFIVCTCRFFISTSFINDFANVMALASLFKKSDTNNDAGLPPPCAKHSLR